MSSKLLAIFMKITNLNNFQLREYHSGMASMFIILNQMMTYERKLYCIKALRTRLIGFDYQFTKRVFNRV